MSNKNKEEISNNYPSQINNTDITFNPFVFSNVDFLQKYKLIKPYDSCTDDEKKELFKKLDNFLEAIYLSPTYFPLEILQALKFREEKLSFWRTTGQIIGGATFSSIWILYKFRFNPSFYFRNFAYYAIFTGISSYLGGRFAEYTGNIKFYREMILKIANDYNITDEEIIELQQKFNEHVIKDTQSKSSLENVNFKL